MKILKSYENLNFQILLKTESFEIFLKIFKS